uniref:Uncharacterized protein n=1 Tax=Arundo donax TaxID=35708 RepID=A0A0A9DFD2_ARUDO
MKCLNNRFVALMMTLQQKSTTLSLPVVMMMKIWTTMKQI